MCCWISRERVRPSVKSKQQKPRRKSRTRAEQRTIRRNFIRKTLSLVILLLCIFPMLGGGMQPMCVIPAALCISMNEDMYFCMAAGVIGGFGMDLACGTPLGANAIFLVIVSCAVCLLFEEILRRSFLHYILLTAAAVFAQAGLTYLFRTVIFRTAGREVLWERYLLPSALWTLAAAVVIWLLYLPLSRLLTKRIRSMDAAAIRRDL